MIRGVCIGFLLACAGLPCLGASPAPVWVLDSEYDMVCVVVSPSALPAEREAAKVFQAYWERCTGFRPEVGPQPVTGMVNVWIGRTDNPFMAEIAPKTVGINGSYLRTFDRSWKAALRNHSGRQKPLHRQLRLDLVIVGDGDRGTLLGVCGFFTEFMGVTVSSDGVVSFPAPPPVLPAIDTWYDAPGEGWLELSEIPLPTVDAAVETTLLEPLAAASTPDNLEANPLVEGLASEENDPAKAENEKLPVIWKPRTVPVEVASAVVAEEPAPKASAQATQAASSDDSNVDDGQRPPVFHLRMDDNAAATVVADAAGGHHDQAFVDPGGAPNTSAHSVPGKVGTALSFDGVDDHIDLGASMMNDLLAADHEFSVAFWWKRAEGNVDNAKYVMWKRDEATQTKGFFVVQGYVPSPARAYLTVRMFNGTETRINWTHDHNDDGVFHHYAILRRGATFEVYRDGALAAEDTNPGNSADLSSTSPFFLCRLGTAYATGVMDDFRIYDRALLAQEIEKLASGE